MEQFQAGREVFEDDRDKSTIRLATLLEQSGHHHGRTVFEQIEAII